MPINQVLYLPRADSTNRYAKQHLAELGPVGAVYTTHQTAGRGRLGRDWPDPPPNALNYTAAIKTDLLQPATLPTFTNLAITAALL